jgi:hypothetical protein
MSLEAGEGRCEEASPQSSKFYIPCNAVATHIVFHHNREYRMCEACTHHNVKNRGAVLRRKYDGPVAWEIPIKPTAEELITEHFDLQDKIKEANKRVAELLAPHKARLEAIDAELHAMLNALGTGDKANLSTDAGTAYLSHLMNVSVDPEAPAYTNASGENQVGRMALIDFALENWNEIGADLLLVQPQKDAVRKWMDDHNGQPPPGLKVGWFTRVNVRRS